MYTWSRQWSVWLMPAMAVLGAILGFLAVQQGWLNPLLNDESDKPSLLRLTVFLASLVLAWFLAIYVHELGHWLMARLLGYRTHLFVLAPLWWTKQGLQVRLRNGIGVAGLVVAMPEPHRRKVWHELLFLAGGVLANFLSVLVVLGLYFSQRNEVPLPVWFIPLAVFGVCSAFMLTELMPVTTQRGMYSDGKAILSLLQGDKQTRALQALRGLSAQSFADVRPRDWDTDMLQDLARYGSDDTCRLASEMFHYCWHRDRGEIDLALAALDRAKAFPEALLVDAHRYEIAFAEGWYRRDLQAAEHWYHSVKQRTLAEEYSKLRAEAVLELLRGNREAAATRAEAALAAWKQPALHASREDRETLEELLAATKRD